MRPSLLSFFLSPIQPVFLVSFCVRHVNGGDALDFRLDFKVISYSFQFRIAASLRKLLICLSIMSMTSPLVEDIGFEPMTPCVQGRCSSQLS